MLLNFFLEQKKVKIKKPKPEFPVYTPLESTYIQSYDHGTSIEEIEEQMDDWLENRNRTQKKQVNLKYIYIYLCRVLVVACGIFSRGMRTLSRGVWDLVP